jgi:hypothetical protein
MSIVPDLRASDAPVFTDSAPDVPVPSMLADSILIDPLVALGETAPPLVTVTDAAEERDAADTMMSPPSESPLEPALMVTVPARPAGASPDDTTIAPLLPESD